MIINTTEEKDKIYNIENIYIEVLQTRAPSGPTKKLS